MSLSRDGIEGEVVVAKYEKLMNSNRVSERVADDIKSRTFSKHTAK